MTELNKDTLAEKERIKYEKMWEHDSYRRIAPGSRHVDKAIKAFGMTPGTTIIDYGTGSGKAAQMFQDAGMDVIGIDHAMNCLNSDVDIPLMVCCLWDLPAIKSEVAYCTDVMEHVPEEKVDEVFKGIAERSPVAFYAIDTGKDNCGKVIGETLHVTIHEAEWWLEKLQQYYEDIDYIVHSRYTEFVCKGKIEYCEVCGVKKVIAKGLWCSDCGEE